MEQKILESLGYTKSEVLIYLSLLKFGSVKVGKMIETSGLQSSTVHNTLHFLIKDGLVSYILKGKTKFYRAIDPKVILANLKDKEKNLQDIMPKLESIKLKSEEKQEAEIYEGTKGIMTLLNELIENTKPNEEYLFFAVDIERLNKEVQEFFEMYDLKRKVKKLITKGLARSKLKPFFSKRKYLKMRYINHPIPSNISICGDKMALIEWGEKPTGILIQSKQIIQNQKEFFNDLWILAEK